ncbi:hypothetical protein COCC4DRAFT_153810 [Bipolaris maydis ATCC 48331]|uniref:Rhodopsin domain-containing protein n=2 Tax=Cochliobolus heterostrophus TaxID=5016 RepID=M2UAY5_COCH5|nr:uncharacterized protein COCC4DRAFT_153810 [Bipolaris maydis ATCC 48331]EMD85112.1 hypothetical protein COCHEDRAFT_1119960 [Bipolaris maydis C5]ENH99224.1 hypothetical protein COCC4DRAFT_153810 [Bipolaris maydis ATCC 48331]KAJ6205409.1 hypothetical protein PSV09DRAFT_1119960 [Bipolaris maydis]
MGIGSRASEMVRIEVAFLVVSWIAIVLRVYVRTCVVKAFGWDDRWMLFAQLIHTANVICATGGALTGTGRLSKDLTPESMMTALRFWWVCYWTYCLTMISAKVSLGLSLLRYTPYTHVRSRRITYFAIWISVVIGAAYGLIAMFQCKPVRVFWTRAIGEPGTCIDIHIIIYLTYVMSAIFAASDFSFAILPVFLIRGLTVSRNQKLALIPILSMGCIASSAVLVRLAYVQTLLDPEFLYSTVPVAIWSEIEMSLAITAGSLSTLRPLYRLAAQKFSWRTSLFSNRRSLASVDMTTRPRHSDTADGSSKRDKKTSNTDSCPESERNMARAASEDLELEVDYSHRASQKELV